MAPSSASSLYDLAAELLTHAQAATATTSAGAIGSAYVSISDPAYDCCPQLTVHARIGDKPAFAPNQAPGDATHRLRGPSLNLFSFRVTLLRCVKIVTPGGVPAPSALNADAALAYEDGWVLWNYLAGRIRDGSLWAGFPCRDVSLGPLQPVNPQGGCAGWVLDLLVSLDGYAA